MAACLNTLMFDLRMEHPAWGEQQLKREAERCVRAKRGERLSAWMSACARARIAESHRIRRNEAAARRRERAKAAREGRHKDALS